MRASKPKAPNRSLLSLKTASLIGRKGSYVFNAKPYLLGGSPHMLLQGMILPLVLKDESVRAVGVALRTAAAEGRAVTLHGEFRRDVKFAVSGVTVAW